MVITICSSHSCPHWDEKHKEGRLGLNSENSSYRLNELMVKFMVHFKIINREKRGEGTHEPTRSPLSHQAWLCSLMLNQRSCFSFSGPTLRHSSAVADNGNYCRVTIIAKCYQENAIWDLNNLSLGFGL